MGLTGESQPDQCQALGCLTLDCADIMDASKIRGVPGSQQIGLLLALLSQSGVVLADLFAWFINLNMPFCRLAWLAYLSTPAGIRNEHHTVR